MSDGGRRVLCVFGTRPEAIKMAPVALRLAADPRFEARVCVTGQHREMLDQVLAVFDLEADHDLAIMEPGQDLTDVTARVLQGVRDVIDEERPELVLVHGDTTTCFAAGLAAFYAGVPVAHVEAGLRTGDLQRPWPEELNRTLVGRFADLHFAPTRAAADNLAREGVSQETVHVTGNTVIDALLDVSERVADEPASALAHLLGDGLAQRLDATREPVVLVTGHRRESFGRGFEDLCAALAELSERHPDWTLVYPVHLNPRVRGPVHAALAGRANVHLVEPLAYREFVWLMRRADVILTDSGGIQEEGPSLAKPVLVTRDVTERPEAVEAGVVRLVGTDPQAVVDGVEEVLLDGDVRAAMTRGANPYGDGRAAERIADLCAAFLEARAREPEALVA